MLIIVLILYHFSLYRFGRVVMLRWFRQLSWITATVSALLVGIGIGIPVTYALSVLWGAFPEPVVAGVLLATLLFSMVSWRLDVGISPVRRRFTLSDFLIVLASAIFSVWLMQKTFHGGTTGELFVGSHNVFDFGMLIGLVRSISFGENIPLQSPYFAGQPFLYHFLFVYWAGILERFGLPIVFAVNIPSVIGFLCLLLVVYVLPQDLLKQKPFVGWLAVFFVVTNSSLTFWKLLVQKNDVLRLQTYPFAGPFDGSIISLFVTLNNYVNQRHLGFSIALGLLVYFFAVLSVQKITSRPLWGFCFGLGVGVLVGWNMVIFLFVCAIVSALFVSRSMWKASLWFLLGVLCSVFVFFIPYFMWISDVVLFLQRLTTVSSLSASKQTWDVFTYFWENVGILPLVSGLGFIFLKRSYRTTIAPWLFVCAVVWCIWAVRGGFEQKSYSFFILIMDILAAVCVGYLLMRRSWTYKCIGFILVGILSVSGIVDLLPVKNEFAFPILPSQATSFVRWVSKHAAKDAIFVSYADIIDPVVFAGRRNYFGFYGNVGWVDRSAIVRSIYKGNLSMARLRGISFIVVPKWEKNDFPYMVDSIQLAKEGYVAYEDDRYIVYAVQ